MHRAEEPRAGKEEWGAGGGEQSSAFPCYLHGQSLDQLWTLLDIRGSVDGTLHLQVCLRLDY